MCVCVRKYPCFFLVFVGWSGIIFVESLGRVSFAVRLQNKGQGL